MPKTPQLARPVREARQSESSAPRRRALQFRWAETISDEEWAIYQGAIVAVREAQVKFLLGGGFALATFTGRWRDTKDVDLYIHPQDRDRVVAALTRAGFDDYYEQRPYDRKWIYRSVKSGVIVDIIWAMANQRAQVDEIWFDRSRPISIRGEKLSVVPMEEFLWCKLYIMQRDHCDWTDLCNLVYANGPRIEWDHLLSRLEEDAPLLKGMLTVYAWLCPKQAALLPGRLWRRLGLPAPGPKPHRPKWNRIRLLDSRYWFAALRPKGRKLDV